MSFLHGAVVVLMLVGAGPTVFAKGVPQDPRPQSQCLV